MKRGRMESIFAGTSKKQHAFVLEARMFEGIVGMAIGIRNLNSKAPNLPKP